MKCRLPLLVAVLLCSSTVLAVEGIPVHEVQTGAVVGFIDIKHHAVFNALHEPTGSWDDAGTYNVRGEKMLDAPMPGALLGEMTVHLAGRRHCEVVLGGSNVTIIENGQVVEEERGRHREENSAEEKRAAEERREEDRAGKHRPENNAAEKRVAEEHREHESAKNSPPIKAGAAKPMPMPHAPAPEKPLAKETPKLLRP